MPLSKCAQKALAALRDFDLEAHLNVPRLAAAIGSAEHDARDAVRELEYDGAISIETRFPHQRRFVRVLASELRSHALRLSPAGRGECEITADNDRLVARTLPDAARELLDSGRAKPGDKARVTHPEHTPFTID
jgi:hypothetical protein